MAQSGHPVTTSPEKHEPRQVRMTETALRPRIRLLSAYAGKRLGMQTRAFSLPARFPAWRSAAARPRTAVRSWHQASPAAGQIMCLRLTGELCAGTADALLDAVGARVRAAVPPACEVVLDLSGTPAIDDDGREALRSLCGLLVDSHARLRIVLPEAAARAALSMTIPPILSGQLPSTRASARPSLPRTPRCPDQPSSPRPCARYSASRPSRCGSPDKSRRDERRRGPRLPGSSVHRRPRRVLGGCRCPPASCTGPSRGRRLAGRCAR